MTTCSPASTLTPPLKWAGGKRWLLPLIQKFWRPHFRLVEPFCGSLSIALGLNPAHALLNDLNPHLINFYRQIQQGLSLPFIPQNTADFYYQARDRFNKLIEQKAAYTPEGAALFYYLNRTGYNGLCRFNKKGFFNVPFGKYATITYQTDFNRYTPLLQRWTFTCQDFESLSLTTQDFIYADPPYDVPFRQYHKRGFSWDDQERLARWLAQHPGPVLLSNQATDRILRLYIQTGFKVILLKAPRRISCTGDRTPAQEVLAIKNIPEQAIS